MLNKGNIFSYLINERFQNKCHRTILTIQSKPRKNQLQEKANYFISISIPWQSIRERQKLLLRALRSSLSTNPSQGKRPDFEYQ